MKQGSIQSSSMARVGNPPETSFGTGSCVTLCGVRADILYLPSVCIACFWAGSSRNLIKDLTAAAIHTLSYLINSFFYDLQSHASNDDPLNIQKRGWMLNICVLFLSVLTASAESKPGSARQCLGNFYQRAQQLNLRYSSANLSQTPFKRSARSLWLTVCYRKLYHALLVRSWVLSGRT